jgi:hypothetical protein
VVPKSLKQKGIAEAMIAEAMPLPLRMRQDLPIALPIPLPTGPRTARAG